eukprot:5730225-Alexandrium_andersonii.AAC.1
MGSVERFHASLQAQVRTLLSDLEERYRQHPPTRRLPTTAGGAGAILPHLQFRRDRPLQDTRIHCAQTHHFMGEGG